MRKFLNSLATLTLIALTVSICANVSSSYAAFGVSPPWVNNDHMLPGTTFEQVVYLSRSDTEKAMNAEVKVTGDEELVKWIEILDKESLIIEKGQNLLPMTVVVSVPENAAAKNYLGGIFVTLTPVVADTLLGDGEVGIALGSRVSVNILVTGDQITDYEIESVVAEPQKQDTPLSIDLEVENKGNTNIADLKGQIDIYDSTNTELIKTLTFVPLDESIASYETKKVEMIFQDFSPGPGEYWVAVKAFKNEEVIYEDRFLKRVQAEAKPEAIAESTTISEVSVTKANNIYLILGLAGFGLALIAFIGTIVALIINKRAKRNLQKNTQA